MSENNNYDAILIGSGMGSLTTASVLARLENKRVLVLEQHFTAGGYTHAFKRGKKYKWDVGLHYIGQVGEKGQLRGAFDFITDGKLKWNKMPDPYDTFVYPDFTFSARDGEQTLKADLQARYPEEKKALERYFRDVQRAINWFRVNEVRKNAPWPISMLAGLLPDRSDFALQTVKEYMDKTFNNDELKSLLASQWGDYGLPPSQAAFVIHAMLVSHYFDGGWYPVGGAEKILEFIEPIIEAKGGKVLTNHRVDSIIVENGRATGVKVTKMRSRKEETMVFNAPLIISGAGAYITYTRLLGEGAGDDYREGILNFDRRNPTTAHLSLYLGLKESPEKLGFKGENHWIFSETNHDALYENRNDWIKSHKPFMAYLSFPSLKDPEAEFHTAEIITFADYENFAEWKDKTWLKRGDDYKALKQNLTDGLLDFIEERYPGFRDLVDYTELSTPLSTVTMTGHHRGTIYGLSGSPERFDVSRSPWCQPRTPVKGLYLTGSEASAWGVSGAMVSGLLSTIHYIKPWNIPKVLRLL